MKEWVKWVHEVFDLPLARMGRTEITLWAVLSLVLMIVVLFWIAGLVRRFLLQRLLPRTHLQKGVQDAIAAIVRYAVLLLGAGAILQTAGLDLTTLSVFAGAIGIGLGLGLQNITNNFISGLIILIERPIKVGDRIEIGNVDGQVVEIAARSTRVVTNDNISIIVPNSLLISENVVNWKHSDNRVRFRIPIGVAYGTDPRLVERVLLEVAHANQDVLPDPPPLVWFRSFGDSSLNFELLVWNFTLVDRRGQFLSDLNFAISAALDKYGIEIPFPQRVVHMRGLPQPSNNQPDPAQLRDVVGE